MTSGGKRVAAALVAAAAVVIVWAVLRAPGGTGPDRVGSAGATGLVVVAAPGGAPPSPAPVAAPATPRLAELTEILESRNDNDPRLDRDFNALTPGEKNALRARYRALAREKRNSRGTIVFLLGKNLSSAADFDFFKEVVAESPCLSIGDCGSPQQASDGESSHFAAENQVTLAYPQLVALKIVGDALAAAPDGPLSSAAREVIASAQRSEDALVARKAAALASRYGHE